MQYEDHKNYVILFVLYEIKRRCIQKHRNKANPKAALDNDF